MVAFFWGICSTTNCFVVVCLLFIAQVWDWDPEKNREILLIDADPMVLVNSPQLTEIIETMALRGGQDSPAGVGRASKGSTTAKDFVEFIGVVFIKLCEILIEILA